MRLFPGAIRNTNVIDACIAGGWGERVGIEAAVAQLRSGDLNALSTLIAHYQNRLYRYLLRLVRRPAEAEDLFQQTWLRVAQKIRSYDPSRDFDAWLFTVARNLAFDHLRRIRPLSLDSPLDDQPDQDTLISQMASSDPTPLDQLLAHERASRLGTALDGLPLIYREVLSLRFEEEMKLDEIAVVLAAPLSTVKSRLGRSLVQLRKALEAGLQRGAE
jgi:RNA polymerase sigma-70 factor, ECF subfamily